MNYQHNLESLYKLVSDEHTLKEEYGEYFTKSYYGRVVLSSKNGILRYAKEIEHLLTILGRKKAKVLDAGCGYGLLSIFLGVLGAAEVWGIDQDEYEISVFNKFLDKVNSGSLGVYAIKGDVLQLDKYLEANCYDAVIARQSISHIGDTDRFIRQVFQILRTGGIFYIKDSNNALDLRGRLHRRKHWKMVEDGPVPPNERPPYNIPYREIRRRMIEERLPHLHSQQLEDLSKETAGLWGEEIYKAAKDYLNHNKVPTKHSIVPRHPVNGAFCELEVNPYALKAKLTRMGFRAKVVSPFFAPASQMKKTAALILRKTHPLSLFVAPQFEIVAIKEP